MNYCCVEARRHDVLLKPTQRYINVVLTSYAGWLNVSMEAVSIVPAKFGYNIIWFYVKILKMTTLYNKTIPLSN